MTRENRRDILIVAVAVAALCLPAVSQPASAQLARVSTSTGAIQFAPEVQANRWVLTVAGNGEVTRREFKGGEAPSFGLTDERGERLPDGLYKWELSASPRPVDINPADYKNAQSNGDGSTFQRGQAPRMERQSGTFRILNGTLVDPDLEEPRGTKKAPEEGGPMTRDFVILDDLIVDGSACIGFDCVNGEVFGFDTIRIKENNLRIKADDTSVAASFPRNDWQITFNASANGGAEKFSIEDISNSRTPFTIEASAPTNSLYVDDGGRLGLGTAVPSVELHVIDGDTPTLRLEQDGSSGFTPQIWDVAGNETNFFIRDVTNGSALPLRIRPGAPSNTVFMDLDGDVGVGTSSPGTLFAGTDASLHIRRTDGESSILVEEASSTAAARTLLELNNQAAGAASQTIFTLVRDNDGDRWDFKISNGGFIINKVGDVSGNNEMLLTQTGDATFEGVVSANLGGATLPDYVFEPDYALMPLGELRSFVETNKHLPRIPSRASVEEANGTINMTEMQIRLLEKVEELTLYTIDQEEQISGLETEKAALAERLESLEATVARLAAEKSDG